MSSPLVDAMHSMAYSSRDLARAASIYERMLRDQDCGVILCLAGSLISAGLKQIFVDLIRNNMVDAVVSTGANIVDQDFFEALGFKHYIADDLYKSGHAGWRTARADDRPHLRHADRRGRAAPLRRNHREGRRLAAAAAAQLAGIHPRDGRLAREERQDAGKGWRRLHRSRRLPEGCADLLPGLQRLLGRLRPGRAPAQTPRQAQSLASTRPRISTSSPS